MSGTNQFNHQTWANPKSQPPATNDIPATSHPFTTQQYGAPAPHYQPRSAGTMNSATHGQIYPPQPSSSSLAHPSSSHPTGNATSHDHHIRAQHSPVSPTVSRPTEEPKQHSDRQQWARAGNDGSVGQIPPLQSKPQTYNNMASSGHHPINSPPEPSSKKCRIPDCEYNAYYDVSEQEQKEYCGKGCELQALSTGLVAACVMCKERPRRTGKRVCGRICKGRESQAPQVHGSYYNVPVDRRESRARPGA